MLSEKSYIHKQNIISFCMYLFYYIYLFFIKLHLFVAYLFLICNNSSSVAQNDAPKN